jgi:hypothetical protein
VKITVAYYTVIGFGYSKSYYCPMINSILHTWFSDRFLLHVVVPQPCEFPFVFKMGVVFNDTRILFQMGEGNAAIHYAVGVGLSVVGIGGQFDGS